MCFGPHYAMIECSILGGSKAHALFMDDAEGELPCCSNRTAE